MERKIGETFEFKGKTYKVVKFNGCANCAFKYNNCPNLTHAIGNCIDFQRSDGAKVMFIETENMEIKDNKLTIDIPKGMEIDILNSNFGTGVICFKKKELTHKDIEDLLDIDFLSIPVSVNNTHKIDAIDNLMDIARYYNGDWKPDWSNNKEGKFYISYNFIHNDYFVIEDSSNNVGAIVFKYEEDAQRVINNQNFREILDTIFKN